MLFTADTATYDIVKDAHIAGLSISSGADGYLMFKCCGNDDPDDWGIYIELNDQANSGYGIIQECRLTGDTIEVDLNEPLSGLTDLTVKLLIVDEAFKNY